MVTYLVALFVNSLRDYMFGSYRPLFAISVTDHLQIKSVSFLILSFAILVRWILKNDAVRRESLH